MAAASQSSASITGSPIDSWAFAARNTAVEPYADDPTFGDNFTFADILTVRLPEISDLSQSTRTAPYSSLHPSPSPPRFFLQDKELVSTLISAFERMMKVTCRTHQDRPLGECPTPPLAKSYWQQLRIHVGDSAYESENFVGDYAKYLNSLLSVLCTYIDATTCGSSILEFSKCGDQIITRRRRELDTKIVWPLNAVGVERKISKVLDEHRPEFPKFSVIRTEYVESMEGMMQKIGLQMNTVDSHLHNQVEEKQLLAGRLYPFGDLPNNRFGAVFTGSHLVMLEAVSGSLQDGTEIPGLTYGVTNVTAQSDADPSVSVLALLLAALYLSGSRRKISNLSAIIQGSWSEHRWMLEQVQDQPMNSGSGSDGGGPEGSDSGDLAGGGPAGGNGRSGKGTGPPYSSNKFLMSGVRYGGRKHHLMDFKYDLEGFRTPARSLLCYHAELPTTEERSVLELGPRGTRIAGNRPSIFRGTVNRREQSDHHVFLKTYPRHLADSLCRELAVYDALRELSCVPRLLAVVVEPHDDYAGLLLEDVGTSLGQGDWDKVQLSVKDRTAIYSAMEAIHNSGVVHRDMAPRNVVRGPTGALSVIDFELATVGHDCTGVDCGELRNLRAALRL